MSSTQNIQELQEQAQELKPEIARIKVVLTQVSRREVPTDLPVVRAATRLGYLEIGPRGGIALTAKGRTFVRAMRKFSHLI